MLKKMRNNPIFFRICLSVALLLCVGFLVVLDATLHTQKYGNLAGKEFLFFPLGILAFIIGLGVKPPIWRRSALFWLFTGLGLLGLVLVPGMSHTSRGASRWIDLGFFTLQPLEIFKLGFILFIARVLEAMKRGKMNPSRGQTLLLTTFIVAAGAIALEPDTDAILLLFLVLGLMVLVSGALRFKTLVIQGGLTIAITGILGITALGMRGSHWKNLLSDEQYGVQQARYAYASGGLLGKGLGESIQKYYIPEPHNDYAFAIVNEEMGILGGILVIGLYLLLLGSGVQVMEKWAKHPFPALLTAGITGLLGLQVLMNLGVSTTLLPVAGLPLPFLSYGGTALGMNCLEAGILGRLALEEEWKG